jgi:hypothetical protein
VIGEGNHCVLNDDQSLSRNKGSLLDGVLPKYSPK